MQPTIRARKSGGKKTPAAVKALRAAAAGSAGSPSKAQETPGRKAAEEWVVFRVSGGARLRTSKPIMRVSPNTLKSLGASPGSLAVVMVGETPSVFPVMPSNALEGGQVVLPDGVAPLGSSVRVRAEAVPPGGLSPVHAAVAWPADPSSLPDFLMHPLAAAVRDRLTGRVVVDGAPVSVGVALLGEEVVFRVRPATPVTGYAWFAASCDVELCRGEPPPEAPTLHVAGHGALSDYLEGRRTAGVVITGGNGVGKTHLARAVARGSGWDVVDLTPATFLTNPESALASLRGRMASPVPTAIILDNIHIVKEALAFAAAQLESLLVTAFADRRPLLVLATAPSEEAVPPALRCTGRLEHQVTLDAPSTSEERLALLSSILKSDGWGEGDIAALRGALAEAAAIAHGFVAADLKAMYQKALMMCPEAKKPRVTADALLHAARATRPASLRSLEISVPNVRWSDIGGQEEAKQMLRECVEWPIRHASTFAELNVRPPAGVLMYGPPGCSKTLLAKALATECSFNFIAVKGPELFNKWVGESEKAVRNVFAKARAAAPAVIFFDELDGMCGKRGGGGVADRVISQFLTEMDGLPRHSAAAGKGQVVVLAATNRPDNIDAALLRPGRIDRKVYIGLPDCPTREQICRIALRGVPLASDVDFPVLAEKLEGRSGAEVVAAMKEGVLECLSKDKEAKEVPSEALLAGIGRVQPRTNQADLEFYQKWGKQRA